MPVVFPKCRHESWKELGRKLTRSNTQTRSPTRPLLRRMWGARALSCGGSAALRFRSVSQDSSVLQESDGRSRSESEARVSPRPAAQRLGEVEHAGPLSGAAPQGSPLQAHLLPPFLRHLWDPLWEQQRFRSIQSFTAEPVLLACHCPVSRGQQQQGARRNPCRVVLPFLIAGWAWAQKAERKKRVRGHCGAL